MKKVLLIAALLVGSIASTNAQDMTFGAKLGFNSAALVASAGDFSATSTASGFIVGGFMTYELSDQFALQPEVLFVTASNEGSVNYINIPLLAKYSFSDAFSAHAGAQVGILATATDADGESVSDSYTGTNFSATVGTAYELEMGLLFSARYNIGLSNIYGGEGDGEIKMHSFNFAIGYRFGK